MTKFDQAKRDKAVDACTSLLKKGHNVENTVAIIALGFLMNEMDDDEINRIINTNFFLKESKIAELIMSYVEQKWNEENNDLYSEFVLIRDHYSGSILQYMSQVDMEIICNLWNVCMNKLEAVKKINKKVNYLNWSISVLSLIGIISIFFASFSNNNLKDRENIQPYEESVEKDLIEYEVNQLLELVGGYEKYSEMIQWVNKNLSKNEKDNFNKILDKGDFDLARDAILNMREKYYSRVKK